MSNIFGSAPQEVPDRDFKMLKALLALIVIQSPYCFQDKLLVKITPKNFTSEDIAIGVLLYQMAGIWLELRPNTTTLHLEGLTSRFK